jgi:hypothetical protein
LPPFVSLPRCEWARTMPRTAPRCRAARQRGLRPHSFCTRIHSDRLPPRRRRWAGGLISVSSRTLSPISDGEKQSSVRPRISGEASRTMITAVHGLGIGRNKRPRCPEEWDQAAGPVSAPQRFNDEAFGPRPVGASRALSSMGNRFRARDAGARELRLLRRSLLGY